MNEPIAGTATLAVAAADPSYEGVGRRLLAALLDNAVCLVAFLIVVALIPIDPDDGGVTLVASLVLFSVWFNYFAFAEWRWGQTIGKSAMSMRVTTESGERPGWNASAIRNLTRLADLLVIGPILIATSQRRQRLGDRFAHTVVVSTRGERPPSPVPTPPLPPPLPPGTPPPPPPAGPPVRPGPQVPSVEEGVGIPPPSWTLGQMLLSIPVLIGVMIVVGIFIAIFDPEAEGEATMLASQAVLGIALVAVAVGFASPGASGHPLQRLGLRRFKRSGLGLALAAYGSYLFFGVIYSIFVSPEQQDITRDLGVEESTLATIAGGFLIVVVAPISEEVFFRGFMFGALRTRLSLWPAAAISAAVFSALHLSGGDITIVPPLFALALLLAWLYEYTGSLGPPIALHMLNNGIAFAVLAAT